MSNDLPMIDLRDYKSLGELFQQKRTAIVLLLLAIVLASAYLLFCWGAAKSEPIYYAFAALLVLGSFVAAFLMDRLARDVRCPDCSSELKRFRADLDPKSLDGFLRNHLITFSAHGRSYRRNQNGPFGATEWDRLMREVAVCQKCRAFFEVATGLHEWVNENDRWVIHEHEHGYPIPMDLAKGQTLTQFELEKASEPIASASLCH